MITMIILTGLAMLVLILGFFEIRIPFINPYAGKKNKQAINERHPMKNPGMAEKTGMNYFRNMFRFNKHEINYRILHGKETSDIA